MPTILTSTPRGKMHRAAFLFSISSFLFSTFVFLFAAAIAFPQSSSKPVVAPDLARRFAKFKPVKMHFDSSRLTARERQMVEKLVDAAGLLDSIYWRQSDPEGLKLYLSLADSKDPKDQMLHEYLKINGGRFDLIDDNKPFVGTDPAPPGRGFFLPRETRANLEQRISSGRFEKSDVYSPYTIEKMCAIGTDAEYWGPCFDPYHAAFGDFVNPMADDLREAAALSDDPAFANFLRLRADALLTDDYYKSDLAWMDLENPKFDVVFAPYEVYLDGLLGVKTSYGASIMIRNEEESRKLAVFQRYVPDLQKSLPLGPEDLPSLEGKRSPMEVVDAIYRAGDLLHGYQAVADNLPNDPRIHQEKGSKKIFWKNFMDARVNYVIVPLAKRLMRPDQAALVTGDGTLEFVIMHEISHGLGPTYVHGSNKTDIREAIGPQYSSLEEAKADITGMLCMQWLMDHGAVPKEKAAEIDASYLGDGFRTIRFGIAEAHGQAAMMEFNYLVERGAIRHNAAGLYEIDSAKFPGAIASLAKELLEQEAAGNRARAENWFKKYAVMPPELAAALAKSSDIPVDVDPDFDFHPPVR